MRTGIPIRRSRWSRLSLRGAHIRGSRSFSGSGLVPFSAHSRGSRGAPHSRGNARPRAPPLTTSRYRRAARSVRGLRIAGAGCGPVSFRIRTPRSARACLRRPSALSSWSSAVASAGRDRGARGRRRSRARIGSAGRRAACRAVLGDEVLERRHHAVARRPLVDRVRERAFSPPSSQLLARPGTIPRRAQGWRNSSGIRSGA